MFATQIGTKQWILQTICRCDQYMALFWEFYDQEIDNYNLTANMDVPTDFWALQIDFSFNAPKKGLL